MISNEARDLCGYAIDWDEVVYPGGPATRVFIAFWLKVGRLAAGMNVNVWEVADPIAAVVASQDPLMSPASLTPTSSSPAWSNDRGR